LKGSKDKKMGSSKGDKNKDDATKYGSKSFNPQNKGTEVHAPALNILMIVVTWSISVPVVVLDKKCNV
jgi:hypothetical protein